MKKIISVLLACIMLFSFCIINGFALELGSLSEVYKELPISTKEGQKILSDFSAEVSYTEETLGLSITELNGETFEMLKKMAIQNLNNTNYDFSGLIDAVVLSCEQNRLQAQQARTSENGPVSRITTTKVVRSFGVISGEWCDDVPVGTAHAIIKTVNVGVSTGTTLPTKDGQSSVTLTAGFSKSVSCTISGPADGTKLYGGRIATHRTGFGVLFGTIIEERYESPSSGITVTTVKVSKDSATTTDYTVLSAIGIPTYANNTTGTAVKKFSNQLDFQAEIKSHPEAFL